MNIVFRPRTILMFFLAVVTLLLLANVMGIYIKHYMEFPHMKTIIRLVDFDTEMNVPTLYSSFAMAIGAALLTLVGYIHKQRKEPSFAWFGLAFIFLFLSVDESSEFHEMLVGPMRSAFDATGALYFAWVIPYGILAIVFCILYFRFLMRLPRKFLVLYVFAGTLFLSGALGFELVGGVLAEASGTDTLIYSVSYTCEELLEMLGIVFLIYTTSRYVVEVFPDTKIEFSDQK